MTFQDKLKTLRKEKDLSQEELASLLNISRSVVAKWETGIRLPKGQLLDDLAEVLGVNSDELFDDKPSQEVIVEKTAVINRQTKIIISTVCLVVLLLISLVIICVSFDKYEKTNVIVYDNFNLLYEPINEPYKKDAVIEIKLKALSETKQGVLYNDKYISTTVCSDDFTHCSAFIKLSNDKIEVYTTRNGLTGSSYYDFSIDTWSGGSRTDRRRLFNSFINTKNITLLNRDEIIYYFGIPDREERIALETYPVQYGGCILYYFLNDSENEYIRIVFNSSDLFVNYSINM